MQVSNLQFKYSLELRRHLMTFYLVPFNTNFYISVWRQRRHASFYVWTQFPFDWRSLVKQKSIFKSQIFPVLRIEKYLTTFTSLSLSLSLSLIDTDNQIFNFLEISFRLERFREYEIVLYRNDLAFPCPLYLLVSHFIVIFCSNLLFTYRIINAIAYDLGLYKPSSPFTKELLGAN